MVHIGSSPHAVIACLSQGPSILVNEIDGAVVSHVYGQPFSMCIHISFELPNISTIKLVVVGLLPVE
jgi:hypothetical protein